MKLETAAPRALLLGHRGVRPVRRFAARGSTARLPAENTLAAFEYALSHGCDGFEFDVRFTRDRRAVLCHDPQIDGKEISATNYAALVAGATILHVWKMCWRVSVIRPISTSN